MPTNRAWAKKVAGVAGASILGSIESSGSAMKVSIRLVLRILLAAYCVFDECCVIRRRFDLTLRSLSFVWIQAQRRASQSLRCGQATSSQCHNQQGRPAAILGGGQYLQREQFADGPKQHLALPRYRCRESFQSRWLSSAVGPAWWLLHSHIFVALPCHSIHPFSNGSGRHSTGVSLFLSRVDAKSEPVSSIDATELHSGKPGAPPSGPAVGLRHSYLRTC
jgi:hypothetical protein